MSGEDASLPAKHSTELKNILSRVEKKLFAESSGRSIEAFKSFDVRKEGERRSPLFCANTPPQDTFEARS